MACPQFIETQWNSEGVCLLKLTSVEESEATSIRCYISNVTVRELEKGKNADVYPHRYNEEDDDLFLSEIPTTAEDKSESLPRPLDVPPDMWRAWLVHWEAWRDTLLPLSWVHSHKDLCTPEYVSWHDAYMEESPWIILYINDEWQGGNDHIVAAATSSAAVDESEAKDMKPNLLVKSQADEPVNETESMATVCSDTDIAMNFSSETKDSDACRAVWDSYEIFSCRKYWTHLRWFLLSNGQYLSEALLSFIQQKELEVLNTPQLETVSDKEISIVADELVTCDIVTSRISVSSLITNVDSDDKYGCPLTASHKYGRNYHGSQNIMHDEIIKSGVTTDKLISEMVIDTSIEAVCLKGNGNNDNYDGQELMETQDWKCVEPFEMSCIADEMSCFEEKTKNYNLSYCANDAVVMLPTTKEGSFLPRAKQSKKRHKNSNIRGVAWTINKLRKDNEKEYSVVSQMEDVEERSQVESKCNYNSQVVLEVNQSSCSDHDMVAIGSDSEIPADLATHMVNSEEENKSSFVFSGNGATISIADIDDGEIGVQRVSVMGSTKNINAIKSPELMDNSNGVMSSSEDTCENIFDVASNDQVKSSQKRRSTALKGKLQKKKSVSFTDPVTSMVIPAPVIPTHANEWWLQSWQPIIGDRIVAFGDCLVRLFVSVVSMVQRALQGSLGHFYQSLCVLLGRFIPLYKKAVAPPADPQRISMSKPNRCLCNWLKYCSTVPTALDCIPLPTEWILTQWQEEEDCREPINIYHKVVSSTEGNYKLMTLFPSHDSEDHSYEWRNLTAGYRLIRYGRNEVDILPASMPSHLEKYWAQRHRLFLRFNEGIQVDEESWFSVTPELIAAHQANRCRCDVVVDAFCGAGGNTIQLAMTCNLVIAIDCDVKKIEMAQHNAKLYGVEQNIVFIVGDFFQLAPQLKADVVYLSPPWGGMDYMKENVYNVEQLGSTMSCEALMKTALNISSNVALYLPKNSDLFQVISLAGLGGNVDIEFCYMSGKRKAMTAYYGDLIHYSG